MRLNLAKIMDRPGGEIPFETHLDLSDLEFGTVRPVTDPVLVSGRVRNTAGVLMMDGSVSTELSCVCDRCARPFRRSVSMPVQAVLVPELEHDDSEDETIFLLEDNEADVDEIAVTTFVLNMDSKMVCREDCKGLCAICGKNLNDGPCGCRPEPDSRFAVLQQLLDE